MKLVCFIVALKFATIGDGAAQTLNDCIMGVFTNPYTGTVSVTNHGFTCQAWSTQYPHRHPYTEDIFFPYDGGVLGASNFCRQIPGPTSEPTGRTWCHTVHPHIVTDFCDLQICDGTSSDYLINLKASHGMITSPDNDNDGLYDFNIDLLWTTEAPEGEIIRYRVLFAQIRFSDRCQPDGLEIFEANDKANIVLICGDWLFLEENSLGETLSNVLYVHFYTDYQLAAAGFELTYDHIQARNKSGDIIHLRQSKGWIASPDIDLDGLYDMNIIYKWIVETDCSTVVRFQVLYVQIQYTADCYIDYIWISDEFMVLSKMCGYVGARPPAETRTNILLVEFYSDNFFTAPGFNMTFEAIQKSVEVCGGQLYGPSGVVVSPDNDGDGYYDNNQYCTWHIWVAEHPWSVIRYTFLYFAVAPSDNCVKDRLLVSEEGGTKYAYCGFYGTRLEGESKIYQLFFEFYSYQTNAHLYGYTGFKIEFAQRNKSETCGGTITNSSVYVSPPDLDADGYYDFNLKCYWNIKVAANSTILYKFYDMEIEETPDCDTDFVRIIERINKWTCSACPVSNLMAGAIKWHVFTKDICGSNKIPLQRTMTNEIIVNFVSDGRLSYRGFKLYFAHMEIIRREENITGDSGMLLQPHISPGSQVYQRLSCEWTIWPRSGMSIRVEVLYVNIYDTTHDCSVNHLQVSFVEQGRLENSIYCRLHTTTVNTIQVRESWVFIRFFAVLHEDATPGFLVHYERVNDTHVYRQTYYEYSDSGSITPPYQENGLYDYNVFVVWRIMADTGKVISTNFLYIDVEGSKVVCYTDVIYVFGTIFKEAYALCGVTTRHMLTSHDNLVHVTFITDFSVNKAGFNMTYHAFDGAFSEQGCDTVLTGSSDIISSPDRGDGQYGSYLTCLWTIKLEDDFVIVFHVKEMDIQESQKCTADSLEVREDHRTLGKFCGSTVPSPSTTEANMLYVSFITDIFHSGKGFEAVYFQAQDVQSCSPNYHCLLSNVNIGTSSLCDAFADCPNMDDERFCDFRCQRGCDCLGLALDCSGKDKCNSDEDHVWIITSFIFIPSATRKLDISTNPHVFRPMSLGKQNLFLLTHLNVSHCGITELDYDLFKSMVKLKVLDVSYNKLRRITSDLFSTLLELEYLILVGNLEPITFEPRAFAGISHLHLEIAGLHIDRISEFAFSTLNVTELKIYDSQIDTFEINALGELYSKSIYLNSSTINDFTEGMFDGVQDIEILKTDQFKFCCVRPVTVSEDSCFPGKDDVSSCEDLIRIEVLRPVAWLFGILTIFSNISAITFRFTKQRKQLKRTYGLFVTNLSVSDCLMGFYLLIIAVADTYFRNIYIFHDEDWRFSGWCKLAGIMSAVSNESSMLFVGLITLDRIILMKYPLGEVRLTIKHASILIVLVWIIALVLAVVPVVLYPVFEGKFYSLSGVCFALPITRARLPGHAYSVVIFIGFNSVLYALIALGQWYIYREVKISSKSLSESRLITSRDAKVARRLVMVAVTDLLCWLPVFILGILALSGYAIEGAAFSLIAVVVLPINAAGNPVIYTLLAVWQTKAIQKTAGNTEEDVKKEIVTFDYVEQCLNIWSRRVYWQVPEQMEGYRPLPELIDTNGMACGQRLGVAKQIARLFQTLHAQNMVQNDFKVDDVFVQVVDGSAVRVTMVLRPKHTLEPSDYQNNVLSLGSLLVKLSKTSEKNDKAPPGSSNAHVQSTPSTSTFEKNAFEDYK